MADPTRFETMKPAPDRVLIVEDEENARIGYEALLRRWGHEVLGVGSAEDALTRQLRDTGRLGDLIGGSKTMQDVMRILEQVSPSSASVLITGETGSGKEILARTIHRLSPRAERPFIAINCSAIPESLMESEIFGHERGAFTGAAERRI